jgi:4,5-DOPA dioxygenase extradiol
MPALFFGHGSPMNALSRNRYSEAWRRMGEAVPRPVAILAISAHWYTRGTALTAMETPRTIHDFGGFPRALYEVRYPAPGSPQLAQWVRRLLMPVEAVLDQDWGLDHGTWSVLLHAFPDADVPVVQLGMDATRPPEFHYELAKRLDPLRDEGVLIAGSGNIVHNLQLMQWPQGAPPREWALQFDDAVRQRIEARDHAALVAYPSLTADARLSVPTPEHLLPLLYVLAQQRDGEAVSFPVSGVEHGSIGMRAVAVGMPETA